MWWCRLLSRCSEWQLLFLAAQGLLIVVASRYRTWVLGHVGFSSCGSRPQSTGSVALMPKLSRSAAHGTSLDQGWKPCLLRRQAGSSLLSYQGSPVCGFLFFSLWPSTTRTWEIYKLLEFTLYTGSWVLSIIIWADLVLCVFTVGHTDIRIEKSRGSSSLSRLKDSESALSRSCHRMGTAYESSSSGNEWSGNQRVVGWSPPALGYLCIRSPDELTKHLHMFSFESSNTHLK